MYSKNASRCGKTVWFDRPTSKVVGCEKMVEICRNFPTTDVEKMEICLTVSFGRPNLQGHGWRLQSFFEFCLQSFLKYFCGKEIPSREFNRYQMTLASKSLHLVFLTPRNMGGNMSNMLIDNADADAEEETRCPLCYQAQNSFHPRTYSNVVTLLLVNKLFFKTFLQNVFFTCVLLTHELKEMWRLFSTNKHIVI